MKILLLDNYDSFTYNLVHIIEKVGEYSVDVVRNDKITIHEIASYNKIVLSPGPGLPNDAGILKELIQTYSSTKSILGVCLGHQAIVEVFGGKLINLDKVYHGIDTPINILKKDKFFEKIPEVVKVGRYHSWVADRKSLPSELEILAEDRNGQIMAIRHTKYKVKGVQFHPESIMTEYGEQMMMNWLEE